MPIKVALVDDNVFLLHAIKEKLSFFEQDIEVVFTASDGNILLKELDKYTVDLILMDIEMPNMNGIEATQKTKQQHPAIKIIMLTVLDDYDSIFDAIKAGANGYLLKEIDPDTLQRSIKETMEGGAAMTPIIAQKTLQLLRNPRTKDSATPIEDISLTKREIEILEQLNQGLSNTKIAANLFISPKTVRNHIENIYKKLQVHSKMEALQKAKNNYLL